MNIIVIVIAAVIFVSGVFVNQKRKGEELNDSKEESVLFEEVTEPSPTSTIPSSPDPTPTLVPSSAPITSDNAGSQNLNIYKYPSSKVISSSNTSLTLESSDNPDTITNWYRQMIKSEDMNVTSFVTAKANDYVLNKLVGANSQMQVSVEIKKDAGDSFVRIVVILRT